MFQHTHTRTRARAVYERMYKQILSKSTTIVKCTFGCCCCYSTLATKWATAAVEEGTKWRQKMEEMFCSSAVAAVEQREKNKTKNYSTHMRKLLWVCFQLTTFRHRMDVICSKQMLKWHCSAIVRNMQCHTQQMRIWNRIGSVHWVLNFEWLDKWR